MFFSKQIQVNKPQPHTDVILFVTTVIKVHLNVKIFPIVDSLIEKYDAKLKTHKSAIKELKMASKEFTTECIKLISREYVLNNILYYFSEDGFVQFVYSIILSEINDYVDVQLSNISAKRGLI